MPSESGIIEAFRANFSAPGGIGDDAAVLADTADESCLIAKDMLMEDVHFRRRYFDPRSLAHKALHVNLSDIAAMGGRATAALLGLSVPKDIGEDYIAAFIDAFCQVCKAENIDLIGGDTTASPGGLFLSVTILGRCRNADIKFRRGAGRGDAICIAGNTGHAALGLKALEENIGIPEKYKEALLRPRALRAEGLWLGRQGCVTAMMDVSDGLYVDLGRLCAASGAGAEIELASLADGPEFESACAALRLDPLQVRLAGGEDYSLLFTAPPDSLKKLAPDFLAAFGYPLREIGKITGEGIVFLTEEGQKAELAVRPFSHFGEAAPKPAAKAPPPPPSRPLS